METTLTQPDGISEMRVFLSSTFTDLQPEREHLIKKIFPEFRALCRERGVEFTEIDLRWGVTEEESRTGKTISICLEEIDKCRPYFLGIMGSHYGWRPELPDIEKDPELLELYPWIRELVIKNKSITELEFTYGVLNAETTDSTFIYEQNSEGRIAADDRAPFDDLKDRLRAIGLLSGSFNSPEELGESVLNDLTGILDRDFPVKKEQTAAERERHPHEAFAHNRTHSYIADPEYYELFASFVDADTAPLILWGRSGYGKSALMAYLTSHYRRHYPDAFIIRHFTGASAGASSSDEVLRHIMIEIKERYAIEDVIPTENLQDEISAWFAKIPDGEKLVLAIDAVNQLTGIGPEMHWLPEFIPPHVRLVISTTPETPLDELRKRNWQSLEIKPLSAEQRKRITHQFLEHYHKHLSPDQLELIAEETKLESPLFLRTLLEELRIFGMYAALDLHLANYLSSESEAELFQKVLARMEHDHGEETVRMIMSAIWASRYGLSETELLGVTGFSRLTLSQFLGTLEFHLLQRSRLFTFFHTYLRSAVESRYLASDERKRAAHRRIAEYFSHEAYTKRRRDEEPWQWQEADEGEAFKKCITDIPMLEMLLEEDRRQELIGYWVELQKHDDLGQTYHTAIAEFQNADEAHFASLSGKLGSALIAASSYKEAEYQLRVALDMRKKLFGEDDLKTAESMNDLATLFYHTGKFAEAEPLLHNAVSIREKLLGKNDPLTATSLNDLAVIYYSQGNLDMAEKIYRDALSRLESYYKKDHLQIAEALNNIGTVLLQRKEYTNAIELINRSLEMLERMHGSHSFIIILPIQNLALTYSEMGDHSKAEESYLKALELNRSIFGEFHFRTSHNYSNLAVFYSRTGRSQKAIEMHTKALEIKRMVLGEDHWETISSYISLGFANYRSGRHADGEKLVETYLPILKKTLGPDHLMYHGNEAFWIKLREETSNKIPSTES
jgi:tetratricopeptide (TPR) repeat protein